jgi:CHAT domain-containing protein
MNISSFEQFEEAVHQAEDHWRRGDWPRAHEAYHRLVEQRLADLRYDLEAMHEADLLVVERLADLTTPFGEIGTSDDLFAAVATLHRTRGNPAKADYLVLKRIHLALGADQLDKALELLPGLSSSIGSVEEIPFSSELLSEWEAGRSWPAAERPGLFVQLYLQLGRLLSGLGQFGEALRALERGLYHSRAGTAPLARAAEAHLLLEIAAAHLARGELDRCSDSLASCRPFDEQQNPGLAVREIELKGKLHLLRGELEPASREFAAAIEVCERRRLERGAGWAAANLAQVRVTLNQLPEANQWLDKIASTLSGNGDPALLHRLQWLRLLAEARHDALLGEGPAAPSASEMQESVEGEGLPPIPPSSPAILSQVPRSSDYLAYFEDRAAEFQWHLARRKLSGAESLLHDIRSDFEQADSEMIQLRVRVLGGMLAYYQSSSQALEARMAADRLQEAAQLFREVQSAYQRLGLKPELYQLQRFLSWSWRRLGRPEADWQRLTAQNQRLLDEIAGSLPPQERATYLVNKWAQDEESLALEINQLVELKNHHWLNPLRRLTSAWKIRSRLHRLIDRIYGLKEALSRDMVNGTEPSAGSFVSTSLLRRLLVHSFRRVTLAFLVLPNRVLIIRLGWMSLDFAVAAMTRYQLRDLVRQWHEQVVNANVRQASRTCEELVNHLGLADLLKTLPRWVRALTIVPDDVLHGFPFAAIRFGKRYLVERFAFTLACQVAPRPSRLTPKLPRVAVLAAVTKPVAGLPALEAGRSQLEETRRWFTRCGMAASLWLDESATKRELLERIPRASLLHLSSHGVFRVGQPSATGLLLLPQDGREQILSLRDFLQLDLFQVEHATLLSCWAADNYIVPGRWVISLPETLWRAGAQSVLACLWEVESRLAGDFIASFYRHLEFKPRDQALRYAQLDLLAKAESEDPLLWAGFQLYGNPGRIPWQTGKERNHGRPAGHSSLH